MPRFYTCPVIAAYMNTRFGMKIHAPVAKVDGSIGESAGPLPLWVWGRIIDLTFYRPPLTAERYRIADESLHLLEPQEGDLTDDGFFYDAENQRWYSGDYYVYRHPPTDGARRIIQRDGKPFFWPESAP